MGWIQRLTSTQNINLRSENVRIFRDGHLSCDLSLGQNILRQAKMIKVAFAVAAIFGSAVPVISIYRTNKQIETLETQVEELTTQLHKIEENSSSLKQHINERTKKLDSEAIENKTLLDQVEYLTSELGSDRKRSKQLEERYKNESLLNIKLENQLHETERQLAKQARKGDFLVQRWGQAKRELEDLKFSYDELQMEYNALKNMTLTSWTEVSGLLKARGRHPTYYPNFEVYI